MADAETALIIGHREHDVAPNNIGLAVAQQLGEVGLELSGVVRSDGLWLPDDDGVLRHEVDKDGLREALVEIDAEFTFLAIPSGDGHVGYNYINLMTGASGDRERPSKVITAEKGALAERFVYVRNLINGGHIYANASLGGGSGILPFLEHHQGPRVDAAHGVVNGTLNFIATNLGPENNWVRAVEQAIHEGFAEPLDEEPDDPIEKVLAVMNGELLGDIAKKTANLWNLGFSERVGETVYWGDLELKELTKDDLSELNSDHRVVVSIYQPDKEIFKPEYVTDSYFEKQVGEWVISAGFIDISTLRPLDIDNENNGLVIFKNSGRNGIIRLVGQGAGPGPTSEAMLNDMEAARRTRLAA